MSWFGLAVRRRKRTGLVRLLASAPLSLQKLWFAGHCLPTLPLTTNEAVKQLALLPMIMQDMTVVVTV